MDLGEPAIPILQVAEPENRPVFIGDGAAPGETFSTTEIRDLLLAQF